MKPRVVIILGVSVVVYVLLGAVGFYYLESTPQATNVTQRKNVSQLFADRYNCITPEQFETFLTSLIDDYENGLIEIGNKSKASDTEWNMSSAVFFSVTVITTIGYGHLYPVTPAGQVFCVIYSIIGIPLCLIFLAAIGQKLKTQFKALEQALDVCNTRFPKIEHTLRVLFILALGLCVFVFIPAIMFVYLDDWDYAQSLYYCIITLTTIGFGDYVPSLATSSYSDRHVFRIITAVWVFVGLAWLAGVISFLQDTYQHVMEKAKDSITHKENSSDTTSQREEHQLSECKDKEKDKQSPSTQHENDLELNQHLHTG